MTGAATPLEDARTAFEDALALAPEDWRVLVRRAEVEAQLAELRDARGEPRHSDRAIELAERTLEAHPGCADAKALLAALHGAEIGRDPKLGPFLGGRLMRLAVEATTEEPGNPRAWIAYATTELFAPPRFGGDRPRRAIPTAQCSRRRRTTRG